MSYSVIKKSVGGKVHFGYSAKDVEDSSLERLLNIFSKLNENKTLISHLNKLKIERDHIAHRSLIITFESMYDAVEIEDKCLEYFWLEDELGECQKLVIEEEQTLKLRSKMQRTNHSSGRLRVPLNLKVNRKGKL